MPLAEPRRGQESNRNYNRRPGDQGAVVRHPSAGHRPLTWTPVSPFPPTFPGIPTPSITSSAPGVSGICRYGGLACGAQNGSVNTRRPFAQPTQGFASRPGSVGVGTLQQGAAEELGSEPTSTPSSPKRADQSLVTTVLQFGPRPGLQRESQRQQTEAVVHSPNVGVWGSTANAAIAAATTLSFALSRFSKMAETRPTGRGALPCGAASLPVMRCTSVDARAVI